MDTAFKVTASFFLILIVDIMPRSRVISIDLGIESFPPQKYKNSLSMGYMYPISTIPLNLNFRQNPSTYMESSHNAPIIALTLLKKKIFSTSKQP